MGGPLEEPLVVELKLVGLVLGLLKFGVLVEVLRLSLRVLIL